MQRAELRARIDAQLLDQQLPDLGEAGQRLGLTAAPVEGEHPQFAQVLAERVLGDQGVQRVQDLGVPAQFQAEFQPGLGGGQPPLRQPAALLFGVRSGDAEQRLALPQGQRGREPVVGGLGLTRRPQPLGLGDFGGEGVHVHREGRIARGTQGVAVADGDQDGSGCAAGPPRFEYGPQPRGVGAYRTDRVVRDLTAPQVAHHLLQRDRLTGPQQQRGEQRDLLRRADLELRPVPPGGHGTEQLEA